MIPIFLSIETCYKERYRDGQPASCPSNILFSKRIFFPAGFALVACVGIIVDGTGGIFCGTEGQGYLKNRVVQ